MANRRAASAGSSAASEHRKRVAARGVSQKILAALAAALAIIVAFWVLSFPVALAVSVLLLLFVLFLAVKARFSRRSVEGAWQRGSLGEQKTAVELKKLSSQFRVYHDVAMKGSKANIDHVVIGPTGIFVLDSKNWKGQAHKSHYGWKYGVLLEQTAQATLAESAWVQNALEPERSRWNVPVYTAWVMTEAAQPVDRLLDQIDVIHLHQALNYITSATPSLGGGRLRKVIQHADAVFDAR